MTFVLSKRSLENAAGIHPNLFGVVQTAINLSTVDFGIATKAVRTAMEQNALYQKGRTLPGKKVTDKDGYKNKSNHQITPDGFGHSVDLTAYVNGKFDPDTWENYYDIAWAMCQAAKIVQVAIRWGGNWDKDLLLCESREDVKAMRLAYKGRLHDGPHFELA